MNLRIFPDTGVLLAMIVFPRDKQGQLTLAGEVLALYGEGRFELVLGQAVVDELDDVLESRFAAFRSPAITLLRPFASHFTRWPTPQEIVDVLPFCSDVSDAPIFASALIARPNIVLSNDYKAFHTSEAKKLWGTNKMEVESLYGLLCVLGRRERREDR